jgi:phosphopentomutase
MKPKRAIVLVIDSFGIGALPDAEAYGDAGSHTALHICQAITGPKWPVLKSLGLGNCCRLVGPDLPGCEAALHPLADFGAMAQISAGKDTTTGHWEIAGIILKEPFNTFPAAYPSFPGPLVQAFEAAIGRRILGNCSASGTEIIQKLGEEHMRTGFPICYTSADSVFQIAAHEEIIPVEDLYRMCVTARSLCDSYRVARVIARPFTGTAGRFVRTERRKDFSIQLPGQSVLDHLLANGVKTVGIGKIGYIFNECGLADSYLDKGNRACLDRMLRLLQSEPERPTCLFVNLVDTDMLYGHRRDPHGYHEAVSEIDGRLGEIILLLAENDLLVVTADHGCDPTHKGTDHTREYVPLLSYRPQKVGRSLGIRKGLADIAATLTKFFNAPPFSSGASFL